ncbi:hypothetical protein ACIA5G_40935 [Amycolatopsis sp. NPDC051758]
MEEGTAGHRGGSLDGGGAGRPGHRGRYGLGGRDQCRASQVV